MNNPKKYSLIVLVIIVFITSAAPIQVFASSGSISLVVNGEQLKPDSPPVIIDGRTLVPVRFISEALGANVNWDPSSRTVTIEHSNNIIQLIIDNKNSRINGNIVELDVPANIIQSRTMVPLRFIGEALGAEVGWDQSTRTVTVKNKLVEITSVVYENINGEDYIKIKGSEELDVNISTLENPDRIVVDLNNAVMKTAQNRVKVGSNNIDQIRIGQFEVDPYITRIVVDMKSDMPYVKQKSEDGQEISLAFVNSVNKIFFDESEESAYINTTGKVSYSSFVLRDNDSKRLVIDINDTILNLEENIIEIDNEYLQRIRAGQFKINPNVSRAVLDLKKSKPYSITEVNTGIKVAFHELDSILDIKHESKPDKTKLIISGTGKLDYKIKHDVYNKMVIDIPNTMLNVNEKNMNIGDGIIDSVSVESFKDKQDNYNTRIKIDLPYYFNHRDLTKNSSNEIVLEFEKSPLLGKKILIDPGHGGKDPGAIAFGVYEKTLNLDLSKRLKKIMQEAGAEIFMTRETDITVPNEIRVETANKIGVDIFFSIHFNAFHNSHIRGVETLYFPCSLRGNKILAQIVHQEKLNNLGLPDRALRERTNLMVLRETNMPAIITEVGFMSNPQDFSKIIDPNFRQKAAEVLYGAIVKYFKR